MASSLPTISAATTATSPATATATAAAAVAAAPLSRHHRHLSHSKLSFRFSSKPKLRFSTKGLQLRSSQNRPTAVKAQLNEEAKVSKPSIEPPTAAALASEESISEFIKQVASLVKLVDSRDIVELQLKQHNCELIIRKKEALPQPPSPAPVVMMHSAPSPPTFQAAAPPPTPSLPAPSASAPAPSLPAKSAKSSFPPLKSPMAGTLYRSPGPGEAPFVKVGDKVKKGQVLCIIEAMKLMNEIEADQSGTLIEVLAEDGKPVSVDTPLFVIEP